jgi:hypothetical protein
MNRDDHLVAHDLVIFGLAALCGGASYLVGESLTIGFLAAGAIVTLGILAMRTGPVRRGANSLILLVAGEKR